MALKLGIDSLGGTKAQLAETIIEASKKAMQKEASKQMEPIKMVASLADADATKKPMEKEAPRAPAPMIEKPKEFVKVRPVGTKGVLAKAHAAEKASEELQKAGREIREEGIRAMNKGIVEFRNDLDAQIGENLEAIANLNNGAKEIRSEMGQMSRDMQKFGKDLREDGMRKMNKGVSALRREVNSQISENLEAAANLNKGAEAIHSEADQMSRDMQKFGKDLREDGTRRLLKGVAEMNKNAAAFKVAIDAQVKVNKECVASFNAGSREIRSDMDKTSREFQKAGKAIRESGARELQKGVSQFNKGLSLQIKANKDSSMKIAAGARELQANVRAYQGDIQRYQEQNLKNYVRDFYFG
jgi:methyl-accepting chemotaxis protein